MLFTVLIFFDCRCGQLYEAGNTVRCNMHANNQTDGVTAGRSDCHVTEINRCASDPCLNGAACNDRNGSFHCTCPPRFTGLRCETSEYRVCLPGFTGLHCETSEYRVHRASPCDQ